MSDKMNRRIFLGQAVDAAAAGAVLGSLGTQVSAKPPVTQPSLEWRNRQPTMAYAKLGRTNFMASRCVFGAGGLKLVYAKSGGATDHIVVPASQPIVLAVTDACPRDKMIDLLSD